MRTRGARVRIGPWLVAFSLLLVTAGCGVLERVPRVTILVQNDAINFPTAAEAAQLVGGETVLTVTNDSDHERQIVIAHLPDGWQGELPEDLLAAEAAREDDRIIGMTNPLEPREMEAAGAGFAWIRKSHTFHFHLRPGETYALFDRHADEAQVVRTIVPTPEGAV